MIGFVHGSSGGELRATRAVELIRLPLSDHEERWLEDYLTHGKGKNLYGAKDTVMMRRIATGRVKEAADLSKSVKSRRVDGLNWETLSVGLQ